jgi:hypothetical protein
MIPESEETGMVLVDIAALEKLREAAVTDAPEQLRYCTVTCWTSTCGKSCGITG